MNNHIDGELISASLDNALSPAERGRVEAHLNACADCRREREGLQKTRKFLASAPRRAMPPELIAALEERLLAPSRWDRLKSWFALPQMWVPAGALAALALLVGLWAGYQARAARTALSLEALLVAHSRYAAEGLVPHGGLASANFSAQLADDSGEEQG
jgi:anti-sigma factor RsiW